jgi:hypothetical protein
MHTKLTAREAALKIVATVFDMASVEDTINAIHSIISFERLSFDGEHWDSERGRLSETAFKQRLASLILDSFEDAELVEILNEVSLESFAFVDTDETIVKISDEI